MNLYFFQANKKDIDFPSIYDHFTVRSFFDFTKRYNIFDAIEDPVHENSLLITSIGITLEYWKSLYIEPEVLEELNRMDFDKNIPVNIFDPNTDAWAAVKNKKILIFCNDKTFPNKHSIKYLGALKLVLEKLKFKQENVYIVAQIKSDIEEIKKVLGTEINICYRDRWLAELYEYFILRTFPTKKDYFGIFPDIPVKKFSVFIRRYEDLRFRVICELISKNLLENFNYTFWGEYKVSTSGMPGSISQTHDCIKLFFDANPGKFDEDKIYEWAKGLPYKLGTDTGYDSFFDTSISGYLANSYLNLVVESHAECLPHRADYSNITEKTYKAMLYKKPFIIFSQPNTLRFLRKCGYRTFSGILNESYDEITDTHERLSAIIKEIERLNNLPFEEFQMLMSKCNHIIEHNYNLLMQNMTAPIPDNFLIKNISFT